MFVTTIRLQSYCKQRPQYIQSNIHPPTCHKFTQKTRKQRRSNIQRNTIFYEKKHAINSRSDCSNSKQFLFLSCVFFASFFDGISTWFIVTFIIFPPATTTTTTNHATTHCTPWNLLYTQIPNDFKVATCNKSCYNCDDTFTF